MDEHAREFHGYLLDEYEGNTFQTHKKHPCELCELNDVCDRIADDLNNIEYFFCVRKSTTNSKKIIHTHSLENKINKNLNIVIFRFYI